MAIDPLTAVALGTKAIASILGGSSKKKAARKKHRQNVSGIQTVSKQRQEDLLAQTTELEKEIVASAEGSGQRSTGGGIAKIRGIEGVGGSKYGLRRERILQQERFAIQESAAEKKAATRSANFQMFSGVTEAAFGFADMMGSSPTPQSSYQIFPSSKNNYMSTPGLNSESKFTFQSGMDFKNQSPYYGY